MLASVKIRFRAMPRVRASTDLIDVCTNAASHSILVAKEHVQVPVVVEFRKSNDLTVLLRYKSAATRHPLVPQRRVGYFRRLGVNCSAE